MTQSRQNLLQRYGHQGQRLRPPGLPLGSDARVARRPLIACAQLTLGAADPRRGDSRPGIKGTLRSVEENAASPLHLLPAPLPALSESAATEDSQLMKTFQFRKTTILSPADLGGREKIHPPASSGRLYDPPPPISSGQGVCLA